MAKEAFATWGWRIPFWVSILLLGVSIWIRLKLHESPVFKKMKEEGKGSKAPLTDSFLRYPNNKYVLLALLGATAGQGVVWYTGQFYALFFMQITLKLDFLTTYTLIGASLLLGTPFFIFFGWLSDKIGRLKIILAGCLIAALTYFPLFKALTHYVNPALEAFQAKTKISVAADPDDCQFHLFVGPWSKFSDCDRAKDFLTKQGLNFDDDRRRRRARRSSTTDQRRSGDRGLQGDATVKETLKAGGYPDRGRQEQGQLPDDPAHPLHLPDLRDHGVRADRGVPGRALPDPDPLHLDVAAVPHRQRLVRRHAAADRDRDGRAQGEHLLRPLVPDHRRPDHAWSSARSSCGDQGPRHHDARARGALIEDLLIRGSLTEQTGGWRVPPAGFCYNPRDRGGDRQMKWVLDRPRVGLLVGGAYYVLTHGGALEMQPEHAVEAPAQRPGGSAEVVSRRAGCRSPDDGRSRIRWPGSLSAGSSVILGACG